jgi:triosephosphate isomerase
MTAKSIEEQIAAIRDVANKASESREYAIEFLRGAGIISDNVASAALARGTGVGSTNEKSKVPARK